MIEIEVNGPVATIKGPFPLAFLQLISSLRGKKIWNKSHAVYIEATKINMALLRNAEFEYGGFKFTAKKLSDNSIFEELATQHHTIELPKVNYTPAIKHREYQDKATALSFERKAYAYLLEMGLGKSAIIIADAGMMHVKNKLTGVLIYAPKGVHTQWVEEQIPTHIDPRIKHNCLLWKKKDITTKEMNRTGLTFLSMNIDSIRTPLGREVAEKFLKLHSGKCMMVVDESHYIKNSSADRTKAAIALGKLATYRRISTGTPIAKNVIDAWSQFTFLDKDILGHPYMTSFRARYCVMGGFEGRQIVGQRNVEEFYSLIAPHSFRLTKDEALDLPPKIYVSRPYEMGDTTRKHYTSLKKTFMTELDNGEIVDVTNAATALLRLQQVVCGYLPIPIEDGEEQGIEVFSDERLDVMSDIVEQVKGPVIIWGRFINDLFRVKARLEKEYGNDCCVLYYGGTSTKDRKEAKDRFLGGGARFFISNPAAGGTGLNLQGDCQTVIYYSNSFDALHRWQSEDRTHRIGTKGAITYFDIVAAGTIDRAILGNLKAKKSLSSLTLDQIRAAISSG